MFKKILVIASFSLIAMTTAQAQDITLYGVSPVYNTNGTVTCSAGTDKCATITPRTTLETGFRGTLNSEQGAKEATITLFTKEGKQNIEVQDFKVIKEGEVSKIIFTPKN